MEVVVSHKVGGGPHTTQHMGRKPDFIGAQKSFVQAWVLVCRSMITAGIGKLHVIDRIMNQHVFLDMLKNNLQQGAKKLNIERECFTSIMIGNSPESSGIPFIKPCMQAA